LNCLHTLEPPLLHRNITAPNVFFDRDMVAKLNVIKLSRTVDLANWGGARSIPEAR
jgi:hypothetical protein